MVVQKFGGTSVADPEAIRRLIEIVRAARTRDGRGPAVVVSAMSGVTDALLGSGGLAGASHLAEALSQDTVELANGTSAAARALVSGRALRPAGRRRSTRSSMSWPPSSRALAVLREVSPRTLDVVAAMGELLSSRIVAAALTAAGVAAEWVDARQRDRHQRRAHAAAPLAQARPTPRCARSVVPMLDGWARAGARRIRRRDAARAYDDARPRRVGLFGRARRRRRGARARFRSGPTWTACSPPTRASSRAAAGAARCRSHEAAELRVLRRESAAPEHDSPGGRTEHSGAHPELARSPTAAGTLITAAGASDRHAADRVWRASAT